MSSTGSVRSEANEAWAGDPPHRTAARERLLAAAARCIARDGLPATGVAAVAAEAGVSRPTVYRYFEDRQELVRSTLMRAGRALGNRLAERLRALPSASEMAVEAEMFVLAEVPRDPLFSEVWTSTVIDAATIADFTGPAGVSLARESLRELVDRVGWRDAEADEAVEVMMRFLLSLLTAPAPVRSPDELRAFLRRRLLPALGLH